MAWGHTDLGNGLRRVRLSIACARSDDSSSATANCRLNITSVSPRRNETGQTTEVDGHRHGCGARDWDPRGHTVGNE